MKRLLASILMLSLFTFAFASCRGKTPPEATLGLGTSVLQEGEAGSPCSATVTVAAVIVADGRIADLSCGVFKDSYTVSERGVYAPAETDANPSVPAYDALIGKTENEIRATEIDGQLKSAVLSAIADAKAEGARACGKTDKTGIAITGSGSGTNADFYKEDGMNGKASTEATYAAVALDGSGKVSAAELDAVQISRTFGADGSLALPSAVQTKRELGYGYGMKGVSASFGIGLEWFEQADGFCSYLVGKTADGIGSIGISDTGKPTDTALLSSCTVAIGDFVSVAKAAAENAK